MNDELMEEAIVYLHQFKLTGERYVQVDGDDVLIKTFIWDNLKVEQLTPATEKLGQYNVYKDGVLLRHFAVNEICTPVEIYTVIGEALSA